MPKSAFGVDLAHSPQAKFIVRSLAVSIQFLGVTLSKMLRKTRKQNASGRNKEIDAKA